MARVRVNLRALPTCIEKAVEEGRFHVPSIFSHGVSTRCLTPRVRFSLFRRAQRFLALVHQELDNERWSDKNMH